MIFQKCDLVCDHTRTLSREKSCSGPTVKCDASLVICNYRGGPSIRISCVSCARTKKQSRFFTVRAKAKQTTNPIFVAVAQNKTFALPITKIKKQRSVNIPFFGISDPVSRRFSHKKGRKDCTTRHQPAVNRHTHTRRARCGCHLSLSWCLVHSVSNALMRH
jgi:hypothetical protein